MPLTGNYNVDPYFDDYSANSNYYKIMFVPQNAVQARELTQLQSMSQNQIEQLSDQIFEAGSVISGCQPTVIPNLPYVALADYFNNNQNNPVTIVNANNVIVGATSNVRAVAIQSFDGRVAQYPNTNLLYLKYLSTGVAGQKTFLPGETLNVYSANQSPLAPVVANNFIDSINVLNANSTVTPTGNGFGVHITSGQIYQKGYFLNVADQYGIVRYFDQNVANTVLGFNTIETIVTPTVDESLYDIAIGYPNENAPGADRLKLTPVLVAQDVNSIANNSSFFTAYEFSALDGSIVQEPGIHALAQMGDILAQRTYETNGNYTIKPFTVTTQPTSNNQTFSYIINPGTAYIRGNRVDYLSATLANANRATTTKEAVQQIITANYGQYLNVQEFIGSFDYSNFETVTLYDTPQVALTNRRFQAAPLGTAIGTAQVSSALYSSGQKGSPSSVFELYLFNIQMNAGKNFSSVKSLYSTSGGIAAADVVLSAANTAVIQSAAANNLIFPIGKSSLKTLRSSNGTVNRTQFSARRETSATLQSNGYIQVTLAPSAAGGTDQVPYSVGTLTDPIATNFSVILSSNGYSANLAGTVTANTSSNTLIGLGTSFNTAFSNNMFIRIISGGSQDIKRVISVANSTSITLDAPPAFNNTSAVITTFYPGGYVIPIQSTLVGAPAINVTSSTTFAINTGMTLSGAQTVTVQHDVLRTQASQRNKAMNRNVLVKLYANAAVNNTWNLGLTDVFKIKNVYVGASFANTNPDMVTSFTLDNGQRPYTYDHAQLVLNPSVASLGNQQMLVVLDRFTANTASGSGFYSVDSYPIDDANTANTAAIQTIQIPYFTAVTGQSVPLRDCIDFRTVMADTANNTTVLANATLNPAAVGAYTNDGYFPTPDTNFEADMAYYLGRYDLVNINPQGQIAIVNGTPSESPITPTISDDSMTVATVYVPPYPSLTTIENSTINNPAYVISPSIVSHKVYTMADIGTLDKRLQQIEYYTTLNQLEQSASNMQVTDANGLNRFKNGIFADPFTSHAFGDTSNFEYQCSIDINRGGARPLFKSKNIDLLLNASNSVSINATSNVATLNYTNFQLVNQALASKYRNCTGDFWNWSGQLTLFPTYNMNRDETVLPATDATIDISQPFTDFANAIQSATGATIFGTKYGDWVTTASQSSSTSSTVTGAPIDALHAFFHIGSQYTTTTTTSQNTGYYQTSNTFIVPMTQNINLGNQVQDVSVQPYIASTQVAFVATNMKPNSNVYAYFDSTPISQYCAPGSYTPGNSTSTNPEGAVTRTANWGTQLTSDAYGNVYGVFLIPAGTFMTGSRTLLLTDVSSLTLGASAETTTASAVFTASNIKVSSSQVSLAVTTPSIQTSSGKSATSVQTTVSSSTVAWDPIAQTYSLLAPGTNLAASQSYSSTSNTSSNSTMSSVGGVFLSQIALYFNSKDPNLGVTVQICPTVAGLPVGSQVLASCHLTSAQVNVSNDSSVPTYFNFDPLYHSGGTSYSFMVIPDGNSPNYLIYTAATGGSDILTGSQIFSSPYSGQALTSSNAQTWTPLQNESLKFQIFISQFSSTSGTVVFNNDDAEFIQFSSINNNGNNTILVGDEVYLINPSTNAISNVAVTATVKALDINRTILTLKNSSGLFANNETLGVFRFPQHGNTAQANSTTLMATLQISAIKNAPIDVGVVRPSVAVPLGTSVSYGFQGYSNTGVADSTVTVMQPDVDKQFFDYERKIFSKSNETLNGYGKTATITMNLATNNPWLSPVVDLSRKSFLAVENIINNDDTNESSRYGNSLFRYLCSPVVLANGQDAEDLQVYLSAWRPVGSDVEVWCKLLNAQDSEPFYNKTWTKMTNRTPEAYSSTLDTSNVLEYQFAMPTANASATSAFANPSNSGVTQYTDDNGVVYTTFKTWAIKIVGLSATKNTPPILSNVRAIALQV